MYCACAQSIAGLGPLFAPLEANVAAMGDVSGEAGAQSALNAALDSKAALSAALSANALVGAKVSFTAAAMSSLTTLANGLGALQSGLKLPLSGSNCGPSLVQLAESIENNALFKALAALPMGTIPPLQSLAQTAGSLSAANAMGVSLQSASAGAQLKALAQANASAAAAASSAASADASMTAKAAAFVAMCAAVQGNLGISLGQPGGVAMLGAKLDTLSSNASGLGALDDVLTPSALTQSLALLTALASIKSSMGVNLLTPGAGFQVQPKLKTLSKSVAPGGFSLTLPSKSISKTKSASKAKALSKSAQYAYQQGLGNLLSSLPVLPPATLLLAYLFGKLSGQLGVGMLQTSSCGTKCTIPSPPCPFTLEDFAAEIAAEGSKLQAPKLSFEAGSTSKATADVGASASDSLAASAAAQNSSSGKASAQGKAPLGQPLPPKGLSAPNPGGTP